MGLWKMAVPSPSASSKAFAGLLVALLAMATVRGFSQEDLIDSLPGQPKVNFRQFGGYVTVDEKAGRSLYYYFVEADDNPKLKPLSLWLNGGPGCSSIGGGGFTELGPFFPNGDGRSLRRNLKSWNTVSNILFVESPAGVGWSYSNTSSDYHQIGDAFTALDMYRFLLGWYKKFPEYQSSAFFLTGESYAGHYIPQLANVLLEHNRNSSGFKFNLKGLAIGNPLIDLKVDLKATYEYYWSRGMISEDTFSAIEKDCDFVEYAAKGGASSIPCLEAMYMVEMEVSYYINRYDVALDVCYPSIVEQELRLRKWASKISQDVDVCITNEIKFYLNLPEVQRALHANRTNLPYEWDTCSRVLYYTLSDKTTDVLPVIKGIVEQGIPVWIYSGDQDAVVPLLGTRALMHKLAGELGFNTTVPYSAWFHERQVGGWATEYGNILTFATVRGASHMVPLSQPGRALTLFKSFIDNKKLPNSSDISFYG